MKMLRLEHIRIRLDSEVDQTKRFLDIAEMSYTGFGDDKTWRIAADHAARYFE
jgi:hypothetical protein